MICEWKVDWIDRLLGLPSTGDWHHRGSGTVWYYWSERLQMWRRCPKWQEIELVDIYYNETKKGRQTTMGVDAKRAADE